MFEADETSNFTQYIPIEDTKVVDGNCCHVVDKKKCSQIITVAWPDKRYLLANEIENQMILNFGYTKHGYGLVKIVFKLNNPEVQGELSFLYYQDEELSVENKQSYFCENVELCLTDENCTFVMGYLKILDIHFEAFKKGGKDFSETYDCNGNFKKSSSLQIFTLY